MRQLAGMQRFKLKEIYEVDDEFVRSTFPGDHDQEKAVRFDRNILSKMQANEVITDTDIINNRDEIEDIILGDTEIVKEIPMNNLISAIAGLVSNWFSTSSQTAPISKVKVSKAVSNLFKLVDSSLKQAESTGKIESYLPTFFEVCDKLIQ